MIISPPMKLVIFGGGNMGAAFARGFLRVGGLTAEQVTIVEHNAERAQELKSTLPCSVLNVAPHSLVDYQVIFIAVKPQSFVELAKTLRVDSSQLVVSIMAGITIAGLTNKLSNATRVVRAMPNTPSQIGAGVTAWVATDQVTADDRNLVEGLLSAGGKVLPVEREELLDGVTALSGSGPAYVFYLAEAMLDAADKFGFSPEEAKALIASTICGAGQLWLESVESPTELRQRVTSKGGTTEAALTFLEQHKAKQIITNAVEHACQRSIELGKAQ